jgi:serine/threonine-protein kinase
VVRVFDFGTWRDITFLTMEYIPGPTLSQWVRGGRGKEASLGEKLALLKGVASGLAEAHRMGVIHRDLKPQNVILTPEGVPKVLDFGIATAREAADFTQDGHFVGSPRYVSPEQVQGLPLDVRSDLYSFGLLAYFVLTGEDAFGGDTPTLILLAQLKEMPEPIAKKIRIPASLDRLLLRCLSKAPAERPGSLKEVLKALEEIA